MRTKFSLNLKSIWGLVIVFFLIFLLIFLSIKGKVEYEDIAIYEFNQQQLAIARSVARQIEDYFTWLERYLAVITNQPILLSRPLSAYPEIADLPVIKVTIIGPSSQKRVITYKKVYTPTELTAREGVYLSLVKKGKRKYISKTYLLDPNSIPPAWVVDVVYNKGQRLVIWTIDVLKICGNATYDIRSGKTGYAWIINKDGYFLAHYEKSFVGKDAFAVRAEQNPAISFTRVNMIQKQLLLTGKEGTSWYISGWHRERRGKIKKLIAYTSAYYASRQNKDKFWGVAVVAPIDEVKSVIHNALFYQWGLSLTALLIILGTVLYSFYQRGQYTRQLEKEVEQKTEEIKKTHQALLRSERLAAMGRAVAYVTHEIKNPLIAIGGFSNQLLRSAKDQKEKKKLEIIVTEAKRLEAFLKDIGQFAKETVSQKETFNINEIIQKIMAIVESELVSRKINLKIRLSPIPLFVYADIDQIKQILLNVIKNAMESMPEGGELTIETLKNKQVVIKIKDTGSGIPEESLDKVFEPFFSTKKGGTGLGLSICHKLISVNQGEICIESEVGKGTVVTMRLPSSSESENS